MSDQEIYNDGETIWTFLKDANEVNVDYYMPDEGDLISKQYLLGVQKRI
jgi:outer membrane lipoprotein carrier protein